MKLITNFSESEKLSLNGPQWKASLTQKLATQKHFYCY